LLLRLLPDLVNATSLHLKRAFSSTLYIGPARARSDRYYRYQDLSVSEIDPDGKNLPMFLNSLTRKQIDEFSSWVNGWFDFGVQVTRSSGHISLTLLTGMGEVNIVDSGFGISQVLPVLAQIWWASRRSEVTSGTNPQSEHYSPIIAIEQPELHLHPAHQSILADVLAGSIKAAVQSHLQITHFLIETHSDAIINRLGALIAEGLILPSDVNIIIFDRQENKTQITVSSFNDDGELVNWPYGFLSPVISP
jgi:predicted ATPase